MKKILVLSSCVDNMAPQLGFPTSEIEQGNYKNISLQTERVKSPEIRGIVIDGNLPYLESILPIVVSLRRSGIKDSPEKRVIILGGKKEIDGAKTVATIEDLQKEFGLKVA